MRFCGHDIGLHPRVDGRETCYCKFGDCGKLEERASSENRGRRGAGKWRKGNSKFLLYFGNEMEMFLCHVIFTDLVRKNCIFLFPDIAVLRRRMNIIERVSD